MKKLFSLLAVIALTAIFTQTSFTQLTGTKTIPGDYATIAAAITDLNANGVGGGGVTFNVAAGYVEQIPSGGFVINIATNQPNASNQVIFQKSGIGANPICTTTAAGLGTVTVSANGNNTDAFFKLNGTDWITFDAIDLLDNYTGATTGPKTEAGFMFNRASATDGCKNVTIKNCRIVLALINATSLGYGIYVSQYTSGGVLTSATSIAGRHENIFIDGNTIERSITGMYFDGTTDAVSPYSLYNNNIQVGVGSANTIIAGSRTSTNTNTQYGIYAINCDSVKFNNNTIRINPGTNAATHYGIFTSTGTNSNADIIGNNVSDTSNATSSQQSGIVNTFGSTGTNNTVNIQNNTVSNCRYNTATTAVVTYIQNLGTAFTINISGNTVSNNSVGAGASTATSTITGILNSASVTTTGATLNIYNNNVNNISRSQSVAGTGQLMGIQVSSVSYTTNVYGNNVNTIGPNNTTTSTLAGIYISASATLILNAYNNTVHTISRTAGTTTGATYGLYASQSAPTSNVYGNTVYGISNTVTTSTGATYGFYDNGVSPTAVNTYNNTIYNISNSGSGTVIGLQQTNGTTITKNVYGNIVYNITAGAGTTGGQAGGINIGYGTTGYIYNNNIYNVTSYNSTGLSPATFGLLIGTSGTTFYIYNNFISELKAPVATVAAPNTSIIGFFHNFASVYFFYNTIYLDAAGTGANFGSAGVWSNVTYNLDLRNNIIINNSATNGTAFAAAYQRNGTSLSTYLSTSDRNNFYAGIPSANRVIFYDGTNSDQTLSAYKTRVSPKDANSVTENTTFVNTSSSPYDLHIAACTSTQVESNGSIVSTPISITTDFDGNARYNNAGYPQCSTFTATAPDMGADEFGGVGVDAVGPTISYTALGNGTAGSNRSFPNITITDASGINNSAGTKPRCYYKKSTDANAYTGNTFFDNGWKWVEANGTSSPYDFTIDYSILNGGSVTSGDVIQYFVTAQDLASTPNIGINSGTYAGSPTSVSDYANMFPLGGTINQYLISSTYSGVYTVGTNFGDNFTTLTGAGGLFAALNAGVMTGNITAVITTSLTEDGTNDLNSLSYDVTGANYTLRIVPQDASEKLISGSVANALIRFDGNDYVTIDGNNGLDAAGTKYLRFRNTNGTNPTFSFFNDSRRNTITNCYIESNNANVSTAPGTILFGTTTLSDGNDSNTISDCDIRDNSDASGTPAIAIFSSGSTGTVAQGNSNNTITGCNIYDFFLNGGTAVAAVYMNTGTTAWTITNNNIYQTTTRTTTVSSGMNIIIMTNSLGDGFNISGNNIGGSAPNCGGLPWTMTTVTASVTNFIYPIRFTAGALTNANTISNNTIANYSLTLDNPTVAGTLYFDAMLLAAGYHNITGNTIGSQSTSGNITMTVNTGTVGTAFFGIDMRGALGSITNNNIGGFTMAGTNTGACIMTGINEGSTATTAINITNNTVGGTVANSMYDSRGGTAFAQMTGIRSSQAGVGLLPNYTGNIVRNFTDIGPGTGTSSTTTGFLTGISHSGSSSAQINNNQIYNLNSATQLAATIPGTTLSMCGISLTSTGLGASISNNTIYNINGTTTGTGNTGVYGTFVTSSGATVTVSNNMIRGLTNQSTGTAPHVIGINQYWGAAGCTISNNMVTLTNGETTADNNAGKKYINTYDFKQQEINKNTNPVQQNPVIKPNVIEKKKQTGEGSGNSGNDKNGLNDSKTGLVIVNEDVINENPYKEYTGTISDFTNGLVIYGILNDATGIQNMYYNSVYVGGSASTGTNNSYALRKASPTHNMINNLFVNARTNSGSATGKHYVVYSTSTTAGSLNANYNVYIGSNSATIGLWNTTDQTFAQWKTSLARDQQSWSTVTSDINPANLLQDITTGNLNINTANTEAWIVSGKGIAIAGQSSDFSGNSRFVSVGSGTTDIGADEFGALGMTPPSATVDNPPGDGVISTYTLWGRPVTRIAWGTGGTEYPSLDVKYYSGVNPPNVLGGNYSNSYTTVNATGNLTGATYDITYYFGDNETYTIGTPGASTILAKYGSGGTWEVFHLTQPSNNSTLTYNTSTQTFNVVVNGLFDFSSFALTDDGSALPVTMESFDITVNSRDAHLSWVTLSEINNKGFAVERRLKTESGYTQWKELGFINGNGTTTERHQYTFKDSKLVTGAYQYRLKQVDFSNNVEYYQPTNNSDVIIGKPGVFDISQNYPNPSNPKSKIDFAMPFDGKVSIKVYDILGKEVATLVNEFKSADFYTVEFDGSNIASGTYFYRIVAEGDNQKFTKTLKMILVK